MNKIFVIAVILASGSSSRMQGEDKQFYKLVDGKEVITKSTSIFQNLKCIDDIILVTKEESIEKLQQIVDQNEFSKVSKILSGGSTRQKSMINAYNYILQNTKFDNNYEYYILIHDGARPFVKGEIINECVGKAHLYGASAIGMKLKDTIKKVDKNNKIVRTVDREDLYSIQTPQIFNLKIFEEAVSSAIENNLDFTDDCQLLENIDKDIYIVASDSLNFKITTPEDLLIANAIIGGI